MRAVRAGWVCAFVLAGCGQGLVRQGGESAPGTQAAPARSTIVEILRLDGGEQPSGTAFDGTFLWIATMEGNVLRYRKIR